MPFLHAGSGGYVLNRLRSGPERTMLQFVPKPPFDAGALILLVQRDGRIRFDATGLADPARLVLRRGGRLVAIDISGNGNVHIQR